MLETSKFNLKYVTENFSCTSENSFLFEMRKKTLDNLFVICTFLYGSLDVVSSKSKQNYVFIQSNIKCFIYAL